MAFTDQRWQLLIHGVFNHSAGDNYCSVMSFTNPHCHLPIRACQKLIRGKILKWSKYTHKRSQANFFLFHHPPLYRPPHPQNRPLHLTRLSNFGPTRSWGRRFLTTTTTTKTQLFTKQKIPSSQTHIFSANDKYLLMNTGEKNTSNF